MYYPLILGGNSGSKIIISGNCSSVKGAVIQEQVTRARNSRLPVIILDYARQVDFSPFLNQNGYAVRHIFTAEKDSYKPLKKTLRNEALALRLYAQKTNYPHQEYGMMTAFISFLINLEDYDTSKSGSLKELLKKFKNEEKLKNFLLNAVNNRLLSRQDAKDHIQTYSEYAKSGITADIIIAERDFILDRGGSNFTLSAMNQGEAVILCADKNNISDTNDFLSDAWTKDILRISQNMPLLTIINSGYHTQLERLYELTETLSHNTETGLIYCANDIFSGVSSDYSENFTRLFEYTLFGNHSGTSAEFVSRLFGERYISRYTYGTATCEHMSDEFMFSILPCSDYSVTSSESRTIVKERVFTPERIMSMSENDYIIRSIFDNNICLSSV